MALSRLGTTPPAQQGPPPPPPTDEQTEILEAYATGDGLVVEALAGTGKTTTLRQIAQASDGRRRGVYLAYNKAIVREAEGRFPDSVYVTTAHSLAYQAVGKNYRERLNGPRMYASQIATRLKLKPYDLDGHALSPTQRARYADGVIRKFTASSASEPGPEHLPARSLIHGTAEQVWAAVGPVAAAWWSDLSKIAGTLPFSHDVYLKLWQLRRPSLAFDYILFDEAQDADPVIASVVAAQDSQVVYVGDRNQQLYAWRGAVDAMSVAPGKRLALTHSFRFGPEIAAEANRWLERLGSHHRVTGRGGPGYIGEFSSLPDAVLCRTNGTALQAVLFYQQMEVPVALSPGDRNAGMDIKQFAWAARNLMAGKGTDHPELSGFTTWGDILKYAEEEEGGADIKRLVGIINRLGPGAVIDAIDRCVLGEKARVMVSTAHKAKGLEWNNVRVADDFTPPEDGELPDPADLMLAYVTVTRAREVLNPGSLRDW